MEYTMVIPVNDLPPMDAKTARLLSDLQSAVTLLTRRVEKLESRNRK